jgi:hypothetical protein
MNEKLLRTCASCNRTLPISCFRSSAKAGASRAPCEIQTCGRCIGEAKRVNNAEKQGHRVTGNEAAVAAEMAKVTAYIEQHGALPVGSLTEHPTQHLIDLRLRARALAHLPSAKRIRNAKKRAVAAPAPLPVSVQATMELPDAPRVEPINHVAIEYATPTSQQARKDATCLAIRLFAQGFMPETVLDAVCLMEEALNRDKRRF